MSEKVYLEKYELANKWIHLLNKKISVLENIRKRGINRIIIYGASDFALRLLEQCESEDMIELIAIADKSISEDGGKYKNIPLISYNKMQSLVTDNDIWIVITAMGFYEEIVNDFKDKGIQNFILLSELIYDAY